MGVVRSARRWVAPLSFLLIVTLAVGATPARSDARTSGGTSITEVRLDLRDDFLELTNDDRTANDVRSLHFARRISRYATHHSRRMAERGELFHSTSAQLRDALQGTGWTIAGENVGVGRSLRRIERMFMNSSAHRANVLRAAFDHAAIGVVQQGSRYWVTVIFYGS